MSTRTRTRLCLLSPLQVAHQLGPLRLAALQHCPTLMQLCLTALQCLHKLCLLPLEADVALPVQQRASEHLSSSVSHGSDEHRAMTPAALQLGKARGSLLHPRQSSRSLAALNLLRSNKIAQGKVL